MTDVVKNDIDKMSIPLILKQVSGCPVLIFFLLLQIILWGRTEKCLRETCEEISMTGTECHYFVCDVGNREEVYKQAKVVREKVT